jgi:hypothetical protein
VNAHRIEILDRADDDAIVVPVANDFHLEFFPADHRLFDEDFGGGRGVEAALDDLLELLAVVGDAAAGAAHRERGTDDDRVTQGLLDFLRLRQRVRDSRTRALEPDLLHRVLEEFAILRHVDGFTRSRDHLDAMAREHAFADEVERRIKRRLSAHRG